jgi:hypothetical protein
LLIPNNWSVNLVAYSDDFDPDTCNFLHSDSINGEPGDQGDFWTDSLEAHYSSGDNLMWVVYQANTPYVSSLDTGYVDVDVKMTAGTATGTLKIGYFVSNAALDLTDSKYYSVSLENPIEVGSSSVENTTEKLLPSQFRLLQNCPNPFNPTTGIVYELPVARKTILNVYNLLGEEVATLVNGYVEAGSHQVTFDGSG